MKSTLHAIAICMGGMVLTHSHSMAQITGPSTTTSPYLVSAATGVTFTSLLTAGDVVGGYKMCGTPDGTGIFDNGDGTFTLVSNHEFTSLSGATRAHGSTGSFVSKWKIDKSTMAVISGSDLMQTVYLWNTATSSYIGYNAAYPSSSAAMNRFCSADLPAVTAFYNAATGKGTQERIFMNGEEAGNEGRAFGHIVTGPAAGKSYELPYLGKFSWENSVANPNQSDKTLVMGMDDATPGQVYMYIGTKTNSGTDIEKAGLSNGHLYGVTVTGLTAEVSASVPTPGTAFTLFDLGSVQNMTGAAINTASNTAGVTTFLRPEDGAWDPSNVNDFYFATTNSFTSPSRLWKLHFSDINNPAAGGTITAVLDGTEGQKMFDNITIDNYGHIIIVEDVGGNDHLGKVWQYTIATDELKQIGVHDAARFSPGGTNFITNDEEASGVLDAEAVLGPGKFIIVDQAHNSIPGEVVEGGQLLVMYNPDTYNSAPEINITGNGVTIPDGSSTPSGTNFTDMGITNITTSITKSFVVQNTGAGDLKISNITFTGVNAGDFTLVTTPAYPLTVPAAGAYTVTVKFTPSALGTRSATLNVKSNDATEKTYDFAIQGNGRTPEIDIQGNGATIVDGDVTAGPSNNTDFGSVSLGGNASKAYTIQNTGSGPLSITGITFSGAGASDFHVNPAITFPQNVDPATSMTVTVNFTPSAVGTRNATIYIASNDLDESTYDFTIQGIGLDTAHHTTGVASLSGLAHMKLYPNPTGGDVMLEFDAAQEGNVAVAILDVQGKAVVPAVNKSVLQGKNSIKVNTAALSNGIYFLKVSDGSSSANIKLTVMH